MKRSILINNRVIEYNLSIKKVKNINMRIKPDGEIYVSANRYVSHNVIDDFVVSKKDFILKALNKYEMLSKVSPIEYFTENELKLFIGDYCKKIFPYYEKRGVGYPVVKFRNMKTRWGSCNSSKGILTFNTQLRFAPEECVKYVVLHEFTHFLQPNHSKYFYNELSMVCPNWSICRKKLREIII